MFGHDAHTEDLSARVDQLEVGVLVDDRHHG
jgi:hypothetical protein